MGATIKSTREKQSMWTRFNRWRRARPFAGAILMMLSGALVLWAPIALFRYIMLPGNTLWAAFLVGALLVVMGLLQLFVPSYALMAGAIGIILSLVSLVVAVGGLGIGMILGIIGGALSVAWKPTLRPVRSSNPSSS